MDTLKKFMGLFFVLTFFVHVFSPAYAISTTRTERLSEKRFFKKFNRQFDFFKSEINELISFESDDSLNSFFNDLVVTIEQHGHYDLGAILREQLKNGTGSVRTVLLQMASEEARMRAQEALRQLIKEAGGFKAYLKSVKMHKKNNLDIKCRVKKIGLISLIAPLTLFGINSGVTVVSYLAAGIINSYVLVVSAGSAIATFGTYGWVANRLSEGCYFETGSENFRDAL